MDATEPTTPVPDAAHGGPVSHAVFRLARLHKLTAGHLLRPLGLHPGQELVLMRLWEVGPQKQADLAAVMESDSATITRTVQRLVRAGLVRKTPSTTDRRATIIEPTRESLALRRRVEQAWEDLEARTVGDLRGDEREEVLRVLGRLETNLAEAFGAAQRPG